MQVDKTTMNDLSLFMHEEEQSVFHHFNFTRTSGGREWLRFYMGKTLESIKDINDTQRTIQCIAAILPQWPLTISNGTIMVLEKFFETAVQDMPHHPGGLSAFMYKLMNRSDFSLADYTVGHFAEFVKGLQAITALFRDINQPPILAVITERINMLLNREQIQNLLTQRRDGRKLSPAESIAAAFFLRRYFKQECLELIELYGRLDAYYSMAVAAEKYALTFPEFIASDRPVLSAKGLFHPMLHTPVAYDVTLDRQQNFLFLTGANMAGKSTFIKSVGVAVYLAHVGMAVPVSAMQLSYFDGLLSNIQVVDNIVKGESYFFNEVQRIRKTIEKISDGRKWLILIDELFKGTNVQDAMKCSSVVIEGLRKMQNAIFILSTHLYEIGEGLRMYPNIQFRYFETQVNNDQLVFSYQLREGISNDRLGYLILKREGVVELLRKL